MNRSQLLRILLYGTSIFFIAGQLIPYKVIDPVLLPYDQEYNNLLHKYCPKKKYLEPIQKVIYFEDLQDRNKIAYCSTNNLTRIRIVYNIQNWKIQTDEQRFATMWHESFHCYFGIGHEDNPRSLLYAYENYLPKEEVMKQSIELIQKLCK